MILELDLPYEISDIVYITTDPEQLARVVTGYIIREETTLFTVSFLGEEQNFYGFELTFKRDMAKVLGLN